MSHLSQRRDLEDMALIEAFARELRTVERLQMLYLLTYADMASVSAENWTDWKSRLLRLLYEKAHATLLAEGLDGPEHEHTLELRRERLASALAPLVGDDAAARSAVSEFAQALPERYASIVPPADAARHLKLWLVAKKSGFSAELRQSQSGGAELTLVAPDRPGLLAVFSAALAANGIDILAAEVNSLEDGIALDQFIVREPGGGAHAPRIPTVSCSAGCAARHGRHRRRRTSRPRCGSTTSPARIAPLSTCSRRTGRGSCTPSPMPCTGQERPSRSLESPRKGTARPTPSTFVRHPGGQAPARSLPTIGCASSRPPWRRPSLSWPEGPETFP